MNQLSPVQTQAVGEGWRYAPLEGYWDEAVLPSGYPRHPRRRFVSAARQMGFRQFNRFWQTGVQLIRETSISKNATGEPWGNERPLPLDGAEDKAWKWKSASKPSKIEMEHA